MRVEVPFRDPTTRRLKATTKLHTPTNLKRGSKLRGSKSQAHEHHLFGFGLEEVEEEASEEDSPRRGISNFKI